MPDLVNSQAVVIPNPLFVDMKCVRISLPPPLKLNVEDGRSVDGNGVVEERLAVHSQEHAITLNRLRRKLLGGYLFDKSQKKEEEDKNPEG